MKKIKTLGIVMAVVLMLVVAAFAVLAAMGIFHIETDESGKISFSPIDKQSEWEMPLSGKTAVIKTELGDITIALADCPAAEEFVVLDNMGYFEGAVFSTLAENMFIKAEVNGPAFETEDTPFACTNGTVCFVKEEETFPSFFIVTNKKLSGLSDAYMQENGFDKEKIAFYKELGGMPEYEGKSVAFAKVTSGMEVAEKIAAKENSGYTGGYSAAEPVKILSIEIIYPTETNQ
ncbi:MAG: peptidylprolyl isomerase [Oscillospiraceae bacterium]|nr:peptidylprolyl isomerase [Oscillospiraceae bacterium]